ncbi:unnamed protein product [Medioppia subpectinata]|uniref:F-actin binding domain-containing protein n=1 Tax=Medioppia subpectinata TaxID=1979941 RepID=A0A7R9Q2I7_9ACAR|nr:unnamed protein product [Medioppia subpectinata]CAG2110414.1 unnamed protein product [Medioppia subpectinata]
MSPYPGVELTDVYHMLESGYRMECPPGCPPRIFDLMRHCWLWEPIERPSFYDIHNTLETMFTNSSITEEVEKQLERQTPVNVPYKKLSGSSPNIHQMANSSSSTGAPTATTPTSTGADQQIWAVNPSSKAGIISTKSTVVQLRRGGLKSKQAPIPPKRTSSFRDSTYQDKPLGDDEILEGARETMNGIEKVFESLSKELQYDEQQIAIESENCFQTLEELHSRNRASGKGKKSKSGSKSRRDDPDGSHRKVQVASLDVHNVKRAINRYGTMPKGARIGAYLESLRQSQPDQQPLDSVNENVFDSDLMSPIDYSIGAEPSLAVATIGRHVSKNRSKSKDNRYADDSNGRYSFRGYLQRQKSDLTHSRGGAAADTYDTDLMNERIVLSNNSNNLNKSKHLSSKPVASPRLPRNTQRTGSQRKSSSAAKSSQPSTSGANRPTGLDNELNGNNKLLVNSNARRNSDNAIPYETSADLPSPPAPFGHNAIRRTLKKQLRPKDRPPSPPPVGMTRSGSFDYCDHNMNQHNNNSTSTPSPEHIPHSISSQPSVSQSSESSPQHSSTKVETSSREQTIGDDFPPPDPYIPQEEQQNGVDVIVAEDTKSKSKSSDLLSNNKLRPNIDSHKSPAAQLVSELFESFKMKAQKRRVDMEAECESKASVVTSEPSNREPKDSVNVNKFVVNQKQTSKASFLRRFQSKPGPDYPAPAPPIQTQVSRNSIAAEYVTPVLKRTPQKPIETMSQNDDKDKEKYSNNSNSNHKSIINNKNEINSQTNRNPMHNNNGTDSQPKPSIATTSPKGGPKDVSSAPLQERCSGYDADDESKRHSSSSITSLKKLWESQSNNSNNLNHTNATNNENNCEPNITAKSADNTAAGPPMNKSSQNSPKINAKRTGDVLKSLRRSDNSASADNIIFKINEEKEDQSAVHSFLKPSLPNKPQIKSSGGRVLSSGTQKLVKAKSESVDSTHSESSGSKLGLKSIDKNVITTKTVNACDRSSILEISGAIDTSISSLKTASGAPAPTAQTSQSIMQLTDKIQLFRQSCKQFSEDCPPQQRFRFRELLTKFDVNCDQLKTSNTLTTNRLLTDIQNTLRDIVNLVQR